MLTRTLLAFVVLCGISISISAAKKTGFESFVVGNPGDVQPSPTLSP